MKNYPNYFFGENSEYEIVIANTIELRLKAWGLVFENYKQKGYTKEDSEKFWYSVHDAMPDTTTFLTLKDGKEIATLTLVFDSLLGLPADKLYSKELDVMRDNGKHPFEITSLACNCDGLKESVAVLMHMFMLSHLTARYKANATDWVITVNPKHVGYYKRMMLFEQSGEQKSYGKVDAPAVLLVLDNSTIKTRFIKKYGIKDFNNFVEDSVKENRIFRFIRRNQSPLNWNVTKKWFQNNRPLLSSLPKKVFQMIAIEANSSKAAYYINTFSFNSTM